MKRPQESVLDSEKQLYFNSTTTVKLCQQSVL